MRQGLSHRTLCPLGRALDRARRRRRPARCGADQEQLKCQLGCGPGLRVRGRVRAHRAVCEEVPQPNFMGWIQTYGEACKQLYHNVDGSLVIQERVRQESRELTP